MRFDRLAAPLSALALSALPLSAWAQASEPSPISVPTPAEPVGLALTASLAGGGELGLSRGKGGVLEMEAAAGYELPELGLRPEVGIVIGAKPDGHLALRPGIRYAVPGFPVQLRAAVDVSNARDEAWGWRWLLVGVAAELRVTGILGLYGEVDSGAPLRSEAGVPLLVRVGASFRF